MSSKDKSSAAENGVCSSGPKLRFPEFQEVTGWRVTKLNSLLFEAKHRNRSLQLGPEHVLSVSGEHGCVNQIEFMGRSYAGASVKDYHVVEHGDIVYTKSPLKKNPYGIIKENKGKRGIVSTLYAVYRPSPKCSATYLDHFFSVDAHLNSYLQPIVRKGAKNDMKVNNADVLKGDICVPDLGEQQKIAACLDSADVLIAAQGQKVKAVKAHKKGLLQQLFPQEGETQPRLRFPEFHSMEEWAERPLRAVATINPPNSGIPESFVYIDLGSVVEGRLTTKTKIARDDAPSRAQRLLSDGDIIFQIVRPYQKNNLFCDFGDDQAFVASTGYAQIRAKVSSRFLYQSVHTDTFVSRVVAKCTGSGYPAINASDLAEIGLSLPPTLAEQQRIADCLTSLDDLIAAETRKLDTLKTHKKGLMQQLFPQIGEDDA
jgi:type I restriction enzyme S subunit